MKRRHLLHGMSLLAAGTLGGCSRSEPQVRTSTPTGSDRPASTSTPTDTETRTTSPTADAPISVSDVFANPEGPDADAGMRLTLRDPAGETVDSVTYGAMGEGTLYARPET